MGIVCFALKYPHTFYVVAALILFLGVTAAVEMSTNIIHFTLLHHGMIVIGLPYTEQRLPNMPEITGGGSPYGATTSAGIDGSRQPSENELAIARFQGRHVTQITNALIAGPQKIIG